MNSFDSALRRLIEEWRGYGEPDEKIIKALQDEIQSLNDLRASRD